MLRELLKLINYLCDSDLLKTRIGRAFILFSMGLGVFVFLSVNNTIILTSLLTSNDKACVMVNNKETKHLAKLASLCNNNKSDQCFVSRWCIQDQSKESNRLKAKIYQLISCSLNKKGEICSSVVMPSKYERPLYIDNNLLDSNPMVDNKISCGYIPSEEIAKNKYKEFVDYAEMLDISPSLFTYCLDDKKMTLLIQRKGHSSKKFASSEYSGCMDEYCLIEVIGMHAKIKKK